MDQKANPKYILNVPQLFFTTVWISEKISKLPEASPQHGEKIFLWPAAHGIYTIHVLDLRLHDVWCPHLKQFTFVVILSNIKHVHSIIQHHIAVNLNSSKLYLSPQCLFWYILLDCPQKFLHLPLNLEKRKIW